MGVFTGQCTTLDAQVKCSKDTTVTIAESAQREHRGLVQDQAFRPDDLI